jgi:1,4-alpha-glucan branching enzyme
LNTDAEVYDGTGLIGNLGQVIAHPVPSHGYVASASVTIPPLAAVWLRLEPELDEEQSIEPEKATRGVIAAAKAASPLATTGNGALTGSAQPRRAKSAESAAAEAGEEGQADRAATTAASTAAVAGTSSAAPEPGSESTESPDSPDSPPGPSRAANPPE